MTGKQTQGAVAYDGTGALKMAAPEAPAQKKKFRKKETKGKKETKETQHPVVKNGAALLTKGGPVDRSGGDPGHSDGGPGGGYHVGQLCPVGGGQ